MAIVYSYPTAPPESQDLLIGVEMAVQGGEGTPRTKTFTIGSIVELANGGVVGPEGPQGPAGAQGIQGITGTAGAVGPAGLNWQGEWVSGNSYVADDAVGWQGASWFCILATSGTTTPNLATTNWALLASQGAQGIQGVQGPTGAQGPSGGAGTYNETVILLSYDGTDFTYTNVINQLNVTITFSVFSGNLNCTLSSSVLTVDKTIIWASSFVEFGGYLTQASRNNGTSFTLSLTNTNGTNNTFPTSFYNLPIKIQVYN